METQTLWLLFVIAFYFVLAGGALLYRQYSKTYNPKSFTPREQDWDPNYNQPILKQFSLWRQKRKELQTNRRNQTWWGN
jgi:hypothetical protein